MPAWVSETLEDPDLEPLVVSTTTPGDPKPEAAEGAVSKPRFMGHEMSFGKPFVYIVANLRLEEPFRGRARGGAAETSPPPPIDVGSHCPAPKNTLVIPFRGPSSQL